MCVSRCTLQGQLPGVCLILGSECDTFKIWSAATKLPFEEGFFSNVLSSPFTFLIESFIHWHVRVQSYLHPGASTLCALSRPLPVLRTIERLLELSVTKFGSLITCLTAKRWTHNISQQDLEVFIRLTLVTSSVVVRESGGWRRLEKQALAPHFLGAPSPVRPEGSARMGRRYGLL